LKLNKLGANILRKEVWYIENRVWWIFRW
jgi:hypothetical protein